MKSLSHGTGLVALLAGLLVASPSAAQLGAQSAVLEIGSDQPGASPAHRIRIAGDPGDPQIYQVTIVYPDGFGWNGFDALAPRGSEVGRYELDYRDDGSFEVARSLRSLSRDRAYVDVFEDQEFAPDFEPLLTRVGRAEFVLRVPFGGDADPASNENPYGGVVSLSLFEGLLVNPSQGGEQHVLAEVRSVDPDSGGADDGTGAPPVGESVEFVIELADVPEGVAFETLRIKSVLALPPPSEDGACETRLVLVGGRFRLGGESDGIDLASEDVTIGVGAFRETMSGADFRHTRRGDLYHARDRSGVRWVALRPDGHFLVLMTRIDLGSIGPSDPVPFSLEIGDDAGNSSLPLRRRRRHCR